MYYVEIRADNSGYTNHRVICLVVLGSSFDSEQVFQVQMDTFDSFWEMDSDKKLTEPDADARVTTIARLFFLRKAELKNHLNLEYVYPSFCTWHTSKI